MFTSNQLNFIKRKTPWVPIGVFIASIFITILFWTILPAKYQINENSDYKSFYEPVARNVLAGNGFVLGDGNLALKYPPGYSLALAGIFGLADLINVSEDILNRIFILTCMGLVSLLIFLIAKKIWGSRSALFCSVMLMTYPPLLWLTKQPNSELPFMVLLYTGFYLFWEVMTQQYEKKLIYFLCGFVLGLAMFIRPIAIGLSALICIMLWLLGHKQEKNIRAFLVAMVLLGNFVAVIPWEAWVYFKTNKVILLSANTAPSIRDGLTFGVKKKGFRKGIDLSPDVNAAMKAFAARYDELKDLKNIIVCVADEFQKQPLAVTKLFMLKAARSWYGTDSQRFDNLILLLQVPYLLMILIASGMCLQRRKEGQRKLAICIWTIVIYFWVMSVLALSILRYLLPTMGLLFILIPAGIELRQNKRLKSGQGLARTN